MRLCQFVSRFDIPVFLGKSFRGKTRRKGMVQGWDERTRSINWLSFCFDFFYFGFLGVLCFGAVGDTGYANSRHQRLGRTDCH